MVQEMRHRPGCSHRETDRPGADPTPRTGGRGGGRCQGSRLPLQGAGHRAAGLSGESAAGAARGGVWRPWEDSPPGQGLVREGGDLRRRRGERPAGCSGGRESHVAGRLAGRWHGLGGWQDHPVEGADTEGRESRRELEETVQKSKHGAKESGTLQKSGEGLLR